MCVLSSWMVALRPAATADLDLLFELHQSLFRPHVEKLWGWNTTWQRRHFRESFEGSEMSVITLAGRTIGYLQTFTAADELYLRNLALLPEAQGRGFGSGVVRTVQQDAARKGLPVKLSVFATNRRAEALYVRLGFVRTGESAQRIEMRWDPPLAPAESNPPP